MKIDLNKHSVRRRLHIGTMLVLIVLCVLVYKGYQRYEAAHTDRTAPEIRIEEAFTMVSVQSDRSELLQGVTAEDDRDGDVTASLVVENVQLLDKDGTIRVSYAAFDGAGNVAKATRTMKYSDYRSPRLTLSQPLVFSYGSGFDVLNIVGAEDLLDGDIRHRLRATLLDESTITAAGVHRVQFSVSNSLGDTVKMELPVEVYGTSMYDAVLTLKKYIVYLPVGAEFDPAAYVNTYTLNRTATDLSKGTLPADYSLDIRGQVQTQTPGVYVLEYRVTYTDRSGTGTKYDPEYTGYSKLIVVVEE